MITKTCITCANHVLVESQHRCVHAIVWSDPVTGATKPPAAAALMAPCDIARHRVGFCGPEGNGWTAVNSTIGPLAPSPARNLSPTT